MANSTQADFDRIAHLPDLGWDHNRHYHGFLLHQLPDRIDTALEIGCGAGELSRRLAERSAQVHGLDCSPEMIEQARHRSAGDPRLEFVLADAVTYPYPPAAFDCIVSVATFHHLPVAELLPRLKTALRPGGMLLILDLYQAETFGDYWTSALAFPLNLALHRLKTGLWRPPLASRQAWEVHGKSDIYPTLAQVRQLAAEHLPGAAVRRHLFWRYSLVWKKDY